MHTSDWRILYRDTLDQDRTSQSIPTREDALKRASELYHRQRAELYKIDGPNGVVLLKQEVMQWVSVHKW
jgi:hypothetical protein